METGRLEHHPWLLVLPTAFGPPMSGFFTQLCRLGHCEMPPKVRDAMLSVPLRVSPILAAERDEFNVRDILTKEITQALNELAGG
ncbi:MAG: hypothetical protein H7832_06085 [Magnetococcus sp. DMHC-6]